MHISRRFGIVAGMALTTVFLSAQRPSGSSGGAPPGATGGAASGAGTTGGLGGNTGTLGGNNSSTATTFPSVIGRTIYLSGKVLLSDGTPPTESVLIERICNGSPHAVAHTDSKGHFSFNMGQNPEVLADASETQDAPMSRGRSGLGSSGSGATPFQNCDIRASLPGFRSDSVSLATQRYMDNPDVGTIVLHRLANVEGFTTSATSALAPKESRKAYEKGLEAARKSKPDEAQKEFEKAVEAYPRYASAWFELGKIYEQRDHIDEARKAYAQALSADSKFINPYERLYMIAVKEGKWPEVAEATDRVMRLNPYDFPNAYYFNAAANLQLKKLDVAERSARQALELDKTHRNPKTDYVLGIILAQEGKLGESVERLRAYLKSAPNGPESESVRKQVDEIEKFMQNAQARPTEPTQPPN